jgi:hypothetical protein
MADLEPASKDTSQQPTYSTGRWLRRAADALIKRVHRVHRVRRVRRVH